MHILFEKLEQDSINPIRANFNDSGWDLFACSDAQLETRKINGIEYSSQRAQHITARLDYFFTRGRTHPGHSGAFGDYVLKGRPLVGKYLYVRRLNVFSDLRRHHDIRDAFFLKDVLYAPGMKTSGY